MTMGWSGYKILQNFKIFIMKLRMNVNSKPQIPSSSEHANVKCLPWSRYNK